MRFEWDENKRKTNLKKHGIDFAEVWQVFENEIATDIDGKSNYGETRYFTLGLFGGVIVAVSHTENDDTIRLISVRKAEKYEEQIYFDAIRN